MHEANVMHSVLEMAFSHMRQHGASRIHRLGLRIGALSGVAPDALVFSFEALKPGTPAGEAVLEVEYLSLRLYCPACDLEFEADGYLGACPACGSWRCEVRQGRELDLSCLEVSNGE